MSEISNGYQEKLLKIDLKSNHVENPVVKDKDAVVSEPSSLETVDENSVKLKESKKDKSTSISFVDDERTNLNFELKANGKSFRLAGEINISPKMTQNILLHGREMLRNKDVNLENGRVIIKNNPVASFVFNFAMTIAAEQMKEESIPKTREAIKPHVRTFEKMTDKKAKISDFSEEERTFLKNKMGVELRQNEQGGVDYYYQEKEGSPSRKLTDQEVQEIYQHIKNINDNDTLFNTALDLGQELNEEVFFDGESVSSDSTGEKKSFSGAKNALEVSFPIPQKSESRDERDKTGGKSQFENNYLKKSAEEVQSEINYHYKKLKELDQKRMDAIQQENQQRILEGTANQFKQADIAKGEI